MDAAYPKVRTLEQLAELCAQLKSEGKRVVLCHGCFDLMHIGHIWHFEEARQYGDVLVVTVTPDRYINKGPNRPVFPENLRAETLAGLSVVDYVAINKWASAVETIKLIRPHYFVKGPDYQQTTARVNPNILAEIEAVQQVGGEVTFTSGEKLSSTEILKKAGF